MPQLKKPQKTFTITSRVVVLSELEVAADTLDEALTKAKSLTVEDFVTIQGAEHDSSMQIVQILDTDKWSTE